MIELFLKHTTLDHQKANLNQRKLSYVYILMEVNRSKNVDLR